jgi:hypothetical protein
LWFDWNNDGLLDLLTTAAVRSGSANSTVSLFAQTISGFVNLDATVGLDITRASKFSLLSDLTGDGSKDLGVSISGAPLNVFGFSETGLVDQTGSLGLLGLPNSVDAVSADLTGDQQNEIYVVRGPVGSGVMQVDPSTIEASLSAYQDEKGFTFQATGTLSVDLYPPWQVRTTDIYIGSSGVHPASRSFQLSSDDPAVNGLPAHNPGVDNGFYIGFNNTTNTWTILFSSSISTEPRYVVVKSVTPISNIATSGFDPVAPPAPDLLLARNTGVFENIAPLAGIDSGSSGRSIAAADFDNDMDLDLYVVATGPVENAANVLYENLGSGFYAPVVAAGGAAGTQLGRGDAVSVADYDLDGFLDLFVTNGKAQHPFDVDGPYQLFRNLGNGNHWIELDLEGVKSNRDGVGASVVATAGGVAQMREQNGGMHFRTQNHQRIHFGLAAHTLVDTLTVAWPSGIVQTIENLPADEIVHVLEPSYPELLGQPDYVAGQDVGLYLWKDSFDGPYHLEVNGDGPLSIFTVELLADQPLAGVTPRLLEVNDTLAWDTNHLRFEGRVSSGLDGLDFRLAPGSRALLAVARNGVSNPRQLHIGASGDPLTPAGWVLAADTLPALPAFQGGVDLGLFAGRANGQVRARWNGDGPRHDAELELLFSQTPTAVTPVGFEANDTLATSAYAAAAAGVVTVGWDGLNLDLPADTRMGLAYTQDGLVQPQRVNPASRNLGLPNAYRLPRAEPYGKPLYDPATEAGLYLWQDEMTGRWHVRGAAGGGGGRYTGELVSDQPFAGVAAVSLEANDVLDTTDPTRIIFDLRMWGQWEDGLDFQLAPGAQLALNLTAANPFASPAQAVHVGNRKWPVENLPLDISGR